MTVSYVEMNKFDDSRLSHDYKNTFDYKETLATPSNGKSILIPEGIEIVNVDFIVGSGGSGKVQATNAPMDDIIAGTVPETDWFDSPHGVVQGSWQDKIDRPNAVRQVNVSGTTKIYLATP
jgi:hypothetical protein